MLLRKNRNCIWLRNSNNLFIHQELFVKKVHCFNDNLNHFIVRDPYTSYNQMHPLYNSS